MRRHPFWGTLIAALVLGTTFTFAAGELIALPGGESLVVMHPGVDGVSHPRALTSFNHSPRYPSTALPLGQDSAVTLAVLVRADGYVATAEVVKAEHPGMGFEEAALRAVRGWRFRPAKTAETPVNSYTFVEMTFSLPQRTSPTPDNRS